MDLQLVSRILTFLPSYSQARVSFELFVGIEFLKLPGNQVWFRTKTQRLKSKKKLIDFTVHIYILGQINNLHDSVTFRKKSILHLFLLSLLKIFLLSFFLFESYWLYSLRFSEFLYREIKREKMKTHDDSIPEIAHTAAISCMASSHWLRLECYN